MTPRSSHGPCRASSGGGFRAGIRPIRLRGTRPVPSGRKRGAATLRDLAGDKSLLFRIHTC
ncbi:hypothetical protein STXM2123_5017 [Streptomyces sp. F-3]|nr:hypothetical protein STXM2123_5017 [Streptomyces sp. F-3]